MIAVVTGATGGIGRWIAFGLARAGLRVVLLGRDAERGAAACHWISAQVQSAGVAFLQVDLSSLVATAEAGQLLRVQHPDIAVLVNNAGIFLHRRQVTPEGHDAVLATNHLSAHLLTRLLLPSLMPGARIVNIGSSTSDRARIDPDNLELRRGWGMVRAYGQSKLAMMMTTFEWARRLAGAGITANVVHPGVVATGLVRAGGPIGLVWRLKSRWSLTEEEGADTPLHVCLAPELAAVSGAYFKARQAVAPNRLALDRVLVERVWQATEQLVGDAA
jgi:NAD(P)-dependent dehydrogenase (short-subunit alcohol dehydrogenase family)